MTLVYRVPRQPSAPRIAVWRRLRALGVAQLSDGVVALPEDSRTREHLEWVADQVLAAGGTALLLRAQAMARSGDRLIAEGMAEARAQEYRDLILDAATVTATEGDRSRQVTRLRRELRRVRRRDFFPPPECQLAVAAVQRLAAASSEARL